MPDIKTGFLLADAYYVCERFSEAIELYLTLLEERVRSNRLVLRLHRALLLDRRDSNMIQILITPRGSLKKLIDSTDLRWNGDFVGALACLDQYSSLFLRRKQQILRYLIRLVILEIKDLKTDLLLMGSMVTIEETLLIQIIM